MIMDHDVTPLSVCLPEKELREFLDSGHYNDFMPLDETANNNSSSSNNNINNNHDVYYYNNTSESNDPNADEDTHKSKGEISADE